MDRARLWLGLLLPLVAALDFRYHHQAEMEAFLKAVARNYSSITHLHSIGKSVRANPHGHPRHTTGTCVKPQSSLVILKDNLFFYLFLPCEGRNLWVLVVGRFPKEHRIGIPEFKYVANMHGDEVCMRLGYRKCHQRNFPSGLWSST
ncbi:hypothetical protein HPG69_014883 [Diceros bicornis minor]|uniref:Peptidase M14 domain-containing protein n=1 Tax=Diceros bicornis minor TaxID=77932 RepID=A0A7J7FK45_DICBM|nr:hypothetical protein HPG69_014883 [Diceros bicornis minor]